MTQKKSPLKKRPRRNPGQSLDEKIEKLINEKALPYILFPLILILLALVEWQKWYFKTPPTPIIFSIFALIATLYSIYMVIKIKKELMSLRLGRDGEKAVGQHLEHLRWNGGRVFHDIIGDNFNIDHLIVSPKGVFVVETKTYSKPEKGNAEIIFDGKDISINGKIYNDNIVRQVSAAANWMMKLINSETGKKFLAKPVVAFPGWYVKTIKNSSSIIVLNPSKIDKFFNKMDDTLSAEDVKLISKHIARYISLHEDKE